jgi:hypothetical protein
VCWENRISTCIRLKLYLCLSPCPKISSSWCQWLTPVILAT